MKNVIRSMSVALAMLVLPAVVHAQFTFITNNGAITVTHGGAAGITVVPAATNGYPVTSIGTFAFADDYAVTSVVLPNSITNIGADAFIGCYDLTNVTLGATSVQYIGDYAFSSCALTTVVLPNTVLEIGTNAFLGCPISTVTLPDSITNIGDSAFENCRLTSVVLPDSIRSIGPVVFANNDYLTNVVIPNSVTSIGYEAFGGCEQLTAITLPNTLTYIAQWAFTLCGLTNIFIPASVTNIGIAPFTYCSSLTAIAVDPANPAYVGVDGVLLNQGQTVLIQYPAGLTNSCYTVPGTVTNIAYDAFFYCDQLKAVTIPTSVSAIQDYAFEYCLDLASVYFQGNAPSADSTVFAYDPAFANTTAYYLPGTTGWSEFSANTGIPVLPWLPQMQIGPSRGPGSHAGQPGFGFNISWASGNTVIVDACTNLLNPVWIPVSTNTVSGGTAQFSDPQWTNYPGRYYRVRPQ